MNVGFITLLIPGLLCIAGCATNETATRLETVGPDPALAAQSSGWGFLRVYSARERVPIDVNTEEFFWNNDFGRNEFLHRPAHTAYSIYATDGRLIQQVNNAKDMNDPGPANVTLSPGLYRIEATAEDYDDVTLTVTLRVRIEHGLTTTVHLDGDWNSRGKNGHETVYLPNGHAVGWHFSGPAGEFKLPASG